MRLPLPALLVLLLPSLCHAWGGEGHQLVALIAEDHLTPAAQAAVTELLDGGHISDAAVASWADEVRRERRETAPWHYVNIPVDDPKGFNRARDGRDGDNVIDAIEREAKVLADKSQPREKRVEALKFVIHFVGDLHQPLHCAERDRDKGGNGRLVFYPGRREAVSLHFVWDTLIVRDLVGKEKIADAAASLQKLNYINEKEWSKGTPEDWANESRGVAYSAAYLEVAPDGPPPRLTQNYVNHAIGDSRQQLKRAGVRLATVLNAALK